VVLGLAELLDPSEGDGPVVAVRPAAERQEDEEGLMGQPLAVARSGLQAAEGVEDFVGGHGVGFLRAADHCTAAARANQRPAERPVVGCGHVAGREEERLPLCVDCLQLLLEDVRAFWDGMRRERG
jgi:hypothetical protein